MLAACVAPTSPNPSVPSAQAPTLRPCNDPGAFTVADMFRLNVTGTAWRDSLVPVYLRNVRGASGRRATVNFLVVDFRLTNTTNRPQKWSYGSNGFFFALKNEAGTTYFPTYDLSTMGATAGLVGAALNPGIPIEGSAVFDVPRGPYSLVIIAQNLSLRTNTQNLFAQQEVAGCTL